MTEEQFKQRKSELGFVEGDLRIDNVEKIFTILKDVDNRQEWDNFYSSSIDYSKAAPLDYSLPQYQNYGK